MKTLNKKSIVIPMLFTLITFTSKAQFNGGIMAGVSTGSVEMENAGEGFVDVVEGKNIMGYELGVFLKFKAGPLYIKPIVVYSYQSGHVIHHGETVSYKANKIGIPIMFGLNLAGPLSIEAGPVYNYLVDVTHQFNSYDWTFGKNGLGYRAGIALDFGPLIINASYEGITYMESSSKAQFKEPYKLIFGVALKFGGSDEK